MKRDSYIDVLRFLGLICLVIAHTNAPNWLATIRCFDVPLMVFISALCYHNPDYNYLLYLKKRIVRIYKPVFMFLLLFFFLTSIGSLFIKELNFGINKIIGSFLLLNEPSIGYVWIFRVFILTALITPLIAKLIKRQKLFVNYLILILLILSNYLLVAFLPWIRNEYLLFIFENYIVYACAYSIIITIGLLSRGYMLNTYVTYFTLLCFIFAICIYTWPELPFYSIEAKYPPHIQYILYGTIVSMLLYAARRVIHIHKPLKIIEYTSKNSMWLYLWHIFPVYTLGKIGLNNNYWLLRYVYVIVVMYILQYLFMFVCKRISFIGRICL